MVPMIALKSWTNEQAESHIITRGVKGHVRRGASFEAANEERAKQLERAGLAMRDPGGEHAGGTEAPGVNPSQMPNVPAPSRRAGSLSSSGAVQAQQAPTLPQSVKRANTTTRSAPGAEPPAPAARASVPATGKRRAASKPAKKPAAKSRRSR